MIELWTRWRLKVKSKWRCASSISLSASAPLMNRPHPPGSSNGSVSAINFVRGASARAVTTARLVRPDRSTRTAFTITAALLKRAASIKNEAFRRSDSTSVTTRPVTIAATSPGIPAPDPRSATAPGRSASRDPMAKPSAIWRDQPSDRSRADIRLIVGFQRCRHSTYRANCPSVSRETVNRLHGNRLRSIPRSRRLHRRRPTRRQTA